MTINLTDMIFDDSFFLGTRAKIDFEVVFIYRFEVNILL